mgnify:CR=1 FL=1
MMLRRFLFHLVWLTAMTCCSVVFAKTTPEQAQLTLHSETLVLGAGCFWGVEKRFEAMPGVLDVQAGYAGGKGVRPAYREITQRRHQFNPNNHAEVVQIQFQPELISARQLLQQFYEMHDPTQQNRQGNDVGTQYRSAVFIHDAQQQAELQQFIADLTQQQVFPAPIVTSIEAASTFYPAEVYHQGYALQNPNQPYCQFLVLPKLAKFRKQFAALQKPARPVDVFWQ